MKCLDKLCEIYEDNHKSSTNNYVQLFHRRFGQSGWPMDKRPKETALHVLASRLTSRKTMGVLSKRQVFLKVFSDIQDSNGCTPLLVAAKCSNIEVVKWLLPVMRDVNKRNHNGESPIYIAALNDNVDILREILKTCTCSY